MMNIYVKDTHTGRVHEVGTDSHDALYISNAGHIDFINLQICEGTQYGGYIFCDENGEDLREANFEDLAYIGIGGSIKPDTRKELEEELLEAISELDEEYNSEVVDHVVSNVGLGMSICLERIKTCLGIEEE